MTLVYKSFGHMVKKPKLVYKDPDEDNYNT